MGSGITMSLTTTALETVFQEVLEDGSHCQNCPHRHLQVERHPYGEGYTEEHLESCEVPGIKECPGIEQELQNTLKEIQCLKQYIVPTVIPIKSSNSQAT
jgi:hypothetical protein